jgi:hypothetical protein
MLLRMKYQSYDDAGRGHSPFLTVASDQDSDVGDCKQDSDTIHPRRAGSERWSVCVKRGGVGGQDFLNPTVRTERSRLTGLA